MNDMKTVAIDVRLIGRKRTGDETVFRSLVSALIREDRGMRFLLLTDRTEADDLERIREAIELRKDGRAELVSLPARNRIVWNLVVIPVFLLRNRIDVFHTQYILPFFVPRRTKVVTHIHDISFRRFPEYIGWSDRLFLSAFIPRTMRRSDLLVVPSVFTGDEIADAYGVSESRIVVIPNAAESRSSDPVVPEEIRRVRERYGLPDRFVLSVGTMQPRKDIPTLIRAFADSADRLPDTSLVLVGGRGGHNYDVRIEDAIAESGSGDRVVFSGYVAEEDLVAVYKAARLLVFPSRYEGFGLPLLEAFAQGVPVIASDIPPFREVGGDAPTYFPPGDVATLSRELYTLSVNEEARKRAGDRGRDRTRLFSWERSARELAGVYEGLVRGEK